MADRSNWESIIRSCVLTSQTPLTPYEINRDIRMLEGRDIPYRELGFRSLEDMLRNIPGLRVSSQAGRTVVTAIASAETSHIQRMVRLQKSKKKKPRTLSSAYSYNKKYPVIRRNQSSPNSYRNTFNFNNYNQQNRSANQQNQLRSNQQNNRSFQNNSYSRPTATQPLLRAPSFQTASAQPQTVKPPTPVTPPTTPSTPILPDTPNSLRQPNTSRSSVNRSTPSPASTPTQQKTVTFEPVLEKPSSAQQRLQAAQNKVTSPTSASATSPVIQTASNVPKTKKSLDERLKIAQNGTTLSSGSDPDPRVRLERYAQNRNLPRPVYSDLPTKHGFFYSKVTIDKHLKCSSYPKEAKTKEEAEKIAAQIALEDLRSKEKTPIRVTEDRNLMLRRIVEIVNEHPNGLLELGVVELYTARFNEGLPQDWLKVVERSIKVDTAANDSHILLPLTDRNITQQIQDFEILQQVQYHDLAEFYLHVYDAKSTTEIWGVIIEDEFHDRVVELEQEMRSYYAKNPKECRSSLKITPDAYYAYFTDGYWHRVRCEKYDEERNEAHVFFIDRGDEEDLELDSSKLVPLRPEFRTLPAQAIRVSLAGLEVFEELPDAYMALEELVEKDFLIRINQDVIDGKSQNVLSVELLLPVDEDNFVNYNELMKKQIFAIVEPTYYLSPDKEGTQNVHITFVSEKDKCIYVQCQSKGIEQLNSLINTLTEDMLDNNSFRSDYFKKRQVKQFNQSKLYFAKSTADNCWYRVRITKIITDSEAWAFCVDVGEEMTVKKNELILIEDLNELVALYPSQAVKVKLYKILDDDFNNAMAERLRQLAPRSDVFIMKVLAITENVPDVLVYKRMGEKNLLASINDTLVLEHEITPIDDNNNSKRVKNERSSLGAKGYFPLQQPFIPEIGKYFDVLVTMAAHPGNFTIQPMSSAKDLEIMMSELSKVCKSYTGPALTSGNVKAGNMYAAKYDGDNRWYRGYASRIISENVVVIYYCDYGDFRAVSMDQLQPLDKKFLNLPYQAIKAKLYDVSHSDWSVADSLQFIELTVDKNFVAVVKCIEADNTNISKIILGLDLINTTGGHISDILVKQLKLKRI